MNMMFLTVNLTTWADRWFLAGISVATVFAILIILVFVLAVFSFVATKASNAGKAAQPAQAKPAAAVPVSEASADDMAAVATAVYLYMNNSHDEESGVLTISQGNSSWGSVLNPRL